VDEGCVDKKDDECQGRVAGNRRRDVNFHALGGVPIGFDVICQDRVSLRTN
jgi:hypothetical protein